MIQNLWYIVAAYAVIWGVLFAYVFSVERRQKRLHDELAALEAEIGLTGPNIEAKDGTAARDSLGTSAKV